jgi:PTH1 family peptidyl-tRNA hydrolase
LAGDLKSSWAQEGEALIGRGQWKGRSVCLVKLQTGVNNSGAAVRVLADQLGFGSSDCIIVHDDLDLPLGVVRTRMRGSAGGHRGVASILDAFQTDTFARVKVGIGRPDKRKNVTDYVLRPFPDSDRPVVTQACGVAAERVLSLM